MSAALGLFSQQRLDLKLLRLMFINIIVKSQRLTRASTHISPALRAHSCTLTLAVSFGSSWLTSHAQSKTCPNLLTTNIVPTAGSRGETARNQNRGFYRKKLGFEPNQQHHPHQPRPPASSRGETARNQNRGFYRKKIGLRA